MAGEADVRDSAANFGDVMRLFTALAILVVGFAVPGEAAVVFSIGQAPSGAITGGRLVSGTNNLFAPNGGFALPFPSSFQVFGANAGTGLTLTLSTAEATAGNYTVVLSSLLAVNPLFNALPITAPGAIALLRGWAGAVGAAAQALRIGGWAGLHRGIMR